jgi:flagellum-specific peptidoglycan hydrolase FlgJ
MKTLILTILLSIKIVGFSQSYEEVKDYIYDSTNIEHEEIVLRQAILETGWFESYNCRVRHNLFGFRHRSKTTDDNKNGYFIFDNWKDSVKYYEEWQDKYYKGGDYYEFLEEIGYATSPTYVEKLKGISIR